MFPASQDARSAGPWKSSRASAITSPGSLTQGGRQRPQDRWLMRRSTQPLIQLEGLQEGKAQEAAKVTLRLLNRRCGPLSETTTARIQALPVEKLEALADGLLDFQGPADLATWLAGNA